METHSRRVANAATGAVLDWLDTLPHVSSIGLLGFSQGGALVLQLIRHAPERVAYGVQLAGFLVDDSQPGDEVLADNRPAVFWGRGALDTVIPQNSIARTRAWMATHAHPKSVVDSGLGHDVAGAEVTDFVAFVARQSSTDSADARRESHAMHANKQES